MHPFEELGISDLARAIGSGDIKAEDYAAYVVGRAAELQHLNAFTTFEAHALLEAAHAADRRRLRRDSFPRLTGVPIAVKDNIDVLGFPTTAGTPSLANWRPKRNAPIVQSLLDNGALIAGKANMHEIAMGATSNNKRFGAAKNPYATNTIPGGSSGGSAVAVAARILPGSLGTDTIGSIRIPASLCGLVGFRPSIGRYSQAGIVPLSRTRDIAGPLVRSVADAILLDSVMASTASSESRGSCGEVQKNGLSGLRLGVPCGYFYRNLDEQVECATEKTLQLLTECGVVLVEADIPQLEKFDTSGSFTMIFHEVLRGITQYLAESNSDVTIDELVAQISSPDVKELARGWYGDNAIEEEPYRHEMKVNRPAVQRAFAEHFRVHGLDAIVFPTTAQPARELNPDGTLTTKDGGQISQLIYLQNTDPGSYSGLPGISLPIGVTSDGLPIGLGLDAPHGLDETLLSIAQQVELVLPRIPSPNISLGPAT